MQPIGQQTKNDTYIKINKNHKIIQLEIPWKCLSYCWSTNPTLCPWFV